MPKGRTAEQQKGQSGQESKGQQTEKMPQADWQGQYGQSKGAVRGYHAQEWEETLFEINGVRNTLRHKSAALQGGMTDFAFVQDEMEVNPGLTLCLDEQAGQLFAFEEQIQQTVQPEAQGRIQKGLIFSGLGGSIRFDSADMRLEAEQPLAVTTIEIPGAEQGQAAKAKISASLKDTILVQPNPDMKLELKNGQYTNTGTEEKGTLHFDTAVWIAGKQLADHVRLKYDDAGLRLEEGEKAILDASQLEDIKEMQKEMRRDKNLENAELQIKLVLDDKMGAHVGMDVLHRSVITTIGQTRFLLKNAEGMPGHFHTVEEAGAVFQGSVLHLRDLSIQEDTLIAKYADITIGKETLTLKDAALRDKKTLLAESGQGTLDGKAVKLKGMQFGEDRVLQAETADMTVEGFSTWMHNYRYQEGKTNAYDKAWVTTKIYTGLNRENKDNTEQKDEPVDLFDFTLAAGQILSGGFEKDTEGDQILSHADYTEKEIGKKEEKQGIRLKRKLFTRDGFAELEAQTMRFRKEERAAEVVGKGNFALKKIPYTLITKKGKMLTGIANASGESIKDIDFHIDSKGILSADFADEEAGLNLKKVITPKIENGSESLVKQIKLSGLRIEGGYLKASSVRIDRGFGAEAEIDDEWNAAESLKKLFGEASFNLTIASMTENVQLTQEGLKIQEDNKSTLGKVGISDLFGFLSGEIDYPEGSVEASAEKKVSTPEKPGFLNIPKLNANLGAGLSIPFSPSPFSLELGLTPQASFGGKVVLALSRGKSFGEEWSSEEKMKIEGGLEVGASAGLEAYAGIGVGAGPIANASLKGLAKLEAAIKGGLKLKTAFGRGLTGKIEPAEDFKFSGTAGGEITGSLGLGVDVKLLFWKARLMEIKLAEKTFGKISFEGEAVKDKNQKGMREGWTLEKLQFTAEGLKNKFQKDLKLVGSKSERVLSALDTQLSGIDENIRVAWEALAELKKGRKDTLFAIDPGEKEALEAHIQSLTDEIVTKIEACLTMLKETQEKLEEIASKQQKAAEKSENAFLQADDSMNEADHMMLAASAGGFESVQYMNSVFFKNDFFKTAIASMGIAMLLGEYRKGQTDFQVSDVHKEDVSALLGEYQKDVNLKSIMESRVLSQGRKLSDFSFFGYSQYHDFIQDREKEQKPLLVKELLAYAISGHRPDGDSLPMDGTTLAKLLEVCLKTNVQKKEMPKEASAKEKKKNEEQYKLAQTYAMDTVQKRFGNVFGQSYTHLAKWAAGRDTMDIFNRVKELKRNKLLAEEAYQQALKRLQNTKDCIRKIEDKKNGYSEKLRTLKEDALGAMEDKNFHSDKAANAVKILTEDYSKDMKGGREILAGFSNDNIYKSQVEDIMKKPLHEVKAMMKG